MKSSIIRNFLQVSMGSLCLWAVGSLGGCALYYSDPHVGTTIVGNGGTISGNVWLGDSSTAALSKSAVWVDTINIILVSGEQNLDTVTSVDALNHYPFSFDSLATGDYSVIATNSRGISSRIDNIQISGEEIRTLELYIHPFPGGAPIPDDSLGKVGWVWSGPLPKNKDSVFPLDIHIRSSQNSTTGGTWFTAQDEKSEIIQQMWSEALPQMNYQYILKPLEDQDPYSYVGAGFTWATGTDEQPNANLSQFSNLCVVYAATDTVQLRLRSTGEEPSNVKGTVLRPSSTPRLQIIPLAQAALDPSRMVSAFFEVGSMNLPARRSGEFTIYKVGFGSGCNGNDPWQTDIPAVSAHNVSCGIDRDTTYSFVRAMADGTRDTIRNVYAERSDTGFTVYMEPSRTYVIPPYGCQRPAFATLHLNLNLNYGADSLYPLKEYPVESDLEERVQKNLDSLVLNYANSSTLINSLFGSKIALLDSIPGFHIIEERSLTAEPYVFYPSTSTWQFYRLELIPAQLPEQASYRIQVTNAYKYMDTLNITTRFR